MKKIFLLFLLVIGCISASYAQEQQIEVTGIVTDVNKEPLIGVNITVKNMPGFGVMTDINGKYKIKVPDYSTLIFSYVGFQSKEVLVKDKRVIDVVMKEDENNVLDEVTVTGTGAQKKITVTGAVTTVDVSQLRTPSSSITNALAGNVPGILARQTSGQPGDNISEFWIRGISTFGAGSSALVLVDGFERDLNEVNVEDIETFSVLKDASATAIYGSRGANGVVLITTKRGKEGKTKVNVKVETSYSTRTKTPEFVDGVTYVNMVNEAFTTRSKPAPYSAEDVELFRNGLDPELFPNVDWMNLILKKGAPIYRATVDLSGGGTTARYFVSASYVDEGGMYKTDEGLKEYNTNANYRRWNYRMNIDLNLTKTTLLKVGVSGSLDKQNQPGGSASQIWISALSYNPIATPVKYKDGKWAAQGTGNQINPWFLVTQMGYAEKWNNKIQTTVNLEQDLKFITEGLKFYGRFGYDTNTYNTNSHIKWPDMWKAQNKRNAEGKLEYDKVVSEQLMVVNPHATGDRKEYLEAELHYNRTFGDHIVGGVMKYSQDKTVNTSENFEKNAIQAIERRHQGLAGRFTYGWKYRYFFDFNFGYNGSENFATGHQFGFFPAYSVAWNIAEEPIIKNNLKWMNMFKLRYSYGKVGNDYLSSRFPYLSTYKTEDKYGYYYGDIGTNSSTGAFYQGLTYSNFASTGITWEVAKKHDVGVDFSLFNDKFSGTVDYFHEQRDGIYMKRTFLPYSTGLLEYSPYANVGSVLSRGFDGNVAYNQKIGDVALTFRANMTYSKNEIKEYDEAYSHFDYKRNQGFRVDQLRGLIAEGLFVDYDDIRNSPKQTFGDVAPGDIKYKDVNGDGVIDSNDEVPIGATTRPNLIYGFGLSAQWKGFDFNLHFQGAGKSSFALYGSVAYPLSQQYWGNILTDVVGNYWSLGTNEDPNAKYPRLTFGGNSNNYRTSTYWMRDGSYLRLKNLELGYTLPTQWTRSLYLNKVRIYLMGTNLLTFSSFKLWDPEMGSGTGEKYPLSRTYTIGLTVNL
ncbi:MULTISPECIES: SusC/RagA family TonB-linked outer membrane protein [Bacteroides]|uniref:TonB-linked outer membrane protein, SusC/RagA family n=2 Tax=Bacteroides TaxID=816 RepID=A0A1M4TBZ2_9BACE|nr:MULTISPECIES: TonB-dependent receptor [Bacteroides]THG55825.1 TonB-dependent receptor [Bacteroides faecichinchillae]GCB33465.1 SusC/RagA family TonB-linked outer membrane protein [Bacteroides faecalis]SHE41894.1 TonB-linked outer membrane protein, SusC/RagA family [Bacteroides faecichinchillae]